MSLHRVRRSRIAAIFSARFLTREPPVLRLGGIALVETLKIVVELGVGELDELGQRRAREIAVLVVDRLDPRAIHRQQLSAEQVQLAAQQHELAEHRAEGVAVIAAEVGDGLEVWLQVPQQPDHLDIAVGLGFQPAAGPDPVEVTVDVELQQITRAHSRDARLLRLHTSEPCGREIQPIDKGIDEANRVLRADIIVQRFRQEQSLRSVVADEVRHAAILSLGTAESESVTIEFSHGLQDLCTTPRPGDT